MKNTRILSLDVFRGLTMALMVIVNSQTAQAMYLVLAHAEWDGCTLADLVFPSFLFIVGITTVISLNRHISLEGTIGWQIYKSILKRSILLFLIGLFLNAFPFHFDVTTLRIYGILQRIALCYLICSLLYLTTSLRTQLIIFSGILLGYWLFLTKVPVPGAVEDPLSRTSNWVLYLDKLLLPPGNFYKNFDPEGFLSTIPAVATTLLGLFIGQLMSSQWENVRKLQFMIILGGLFLVIGWCWSDVFPLNKNLWSSSFVLWTGGISLMVFAFCFYVIDILDYKKWAIPFKVLGMNALLVFIIHVFLLKIQFAITVPIGDEGSQNLKEAITNYLFYGFGSENASLFYSLLFLLLNYLVALILYRRKIFFKL